MKKYLFGILAITMAVGFSAFTTKKVTFDPTTFYYKEGVNYQRLQPGITSHEDLLERTILQTPFTTVGNWKTTPAVSFTPVSDMNAYIGSISFPVEEASDGTSDGFISLSEALTAVWNAYTLPATDLMPETVPVTISSAVEVQVTVVAKQAVNEL